MRSYEKDTDMGKVAMRGEKEVGIAKQEKEEEGLDGETVKTISWRCKTKGGFERRTRRR